MTEDTKKRINELEEGRQLQLDFQKIAKAAGQCPDIIPVVVQNYATKEVILLAYTNEKALAKSIETRIATFWSTSRNELWIKGLTSGHFFELMEIRVNCEQNSLLYLVRPKGGPGKDGICHTKNAAGEARNCFYRRLNLETGQLENLDP
ncbi:MAG TPA: phosphoribosyl-AMP cyclohydrolase [Firmicutes bacterium]|nr:phosphoribosyl-AMP cyclohydrolase [Bacillota bacterium]